MFKKFYFFEKKNDKRKKLENGVWFQRRNKRLRVDFKGMFKSKNNLICRFFKTRHCNLKKLFLVLCFKEMGSGGFFTHSRRLF